MQRWNTLAEIPGDLGPTIVTIGNFDGVHRGHQAVLRQVVAEAGARGVRPVAVTFDPHPVAVLYPERAPAQLCGLDHRLELLAETGLDGVLVMEFTHELAQWSPERFVEDVFVTALHAAAVVVGPDMRFGYRNSGDVGTLRELGKTHDFEVLVIDDLGFEDGAPNSPGARRWSSTWARDLLRDGDVTTATAVLGRPHRMTGIVVHGDHRGRELGYPTANLAQDSEGMVPADGVYAGWLQVLDGGDGGAANSSSPMPAAISVGTNPTFDGHERRVEAYVLDRTDLDLYGRRVAVDFVARLRPTLRFDGIEPLVRQMALDVEECRSALRV